MANRARKEMSVNKRYRWLGEQSQSHALQILKKSSLCVFHLGWRERERVVGGNSSFRADSCVRALTECRHSGRKLSRLF